jgi:molybdopterin synthase sulfur carrier subunit
MKVTIRFFSSLREQLGISVLEFETQSVDLSQLRSELMLFQPKFADALAFGKAIRMALNQVVCDGSETISEGCEIAFFPPVTGG